MKDQLIQQIPRLAMWKIRRQGPSPWSQTTEAQAGDHEPEQVIDNKDEEVPSKCPKWTFMSFILGRANDRGHRIRVCYL